jgi:glycosyltransferase involved in cell wall biosynthesis
MTARPLRILQVTEAFGGGVFTSLTRLSTGLAALGHEVHLAYSRRPETPADVASHVAPAVRLHEIALARSVDPIADLRGLFALRRLMAAVDPDIVHLHSSKAGVLGRIVARLSGRQRSTFYSPRGLSFLQEDHSPRARRLYQAIEWASARLGGTIVACSMSERELIEHRIAPRRLALVENAVDVESVLPREPRGDGRLHIGIVGRITYARNSELFAEMSRRLGADDVRFRWIGGGDDAAQAALQKAGVTVTGWMPRVDALAAMRGLDIYLHPSRWEGMPVALIEAQLCGLPAVASDVVGNRDVITPGKTGFLCRSADEMAARLHALVQDAELRDRLGRQARAMAMPRFNLARMVTETDSLYRRALV